MVSKSIRNIIIALIVLLIAIQGSLRYMMPLFEKYKVSTPVDLVSMFEDTANMLTLGIAIFIVLLVPIYFYARAKEKEKKENEVYGPARI